MIAIDFETYYDTKSGFSVKTMGASAYVQDPRFYTTLVAIYGEGIQYVGPVEEFDWTKIRGKSVVAHNAGFDSKVFNLHLVAKGIVDKADSPKEWFCSADLAAYSKYARALANVVSLRYGVALNKKIRKDMSAMTIHQAKEAGVYEQWKEYAMFDAYYCHKIWEDLSPNWSQHEREISKANREMGERGVPIDEELFDKSIDIISKKLWEFEKGIPWDWDDKKTPLSRKQFALHCRKLNLPIPSSCAKDSPEFLAWCQEYSKDNPWVDAMVNWRPTNTFLGKLKSIKERTRNGFMPYDIKYHEAHTGRFSGGGGVNMQNFNRGEFYGVNMRNIIKAPEGYKLVVMDYSQIEPRVLAFLSGNNAFLEECVNKSPYVVHAEQTMGWDPKKDLKKENPALYSLAKARVLGLGYGCGAERFISLAKTYGVELTPTESAIAVKEFRKSNPLITNYWRSLGRLLKASRGEDMIIDLPGGRELIYHNVHLRSGKYNATVKLGSNPLPFYGGKLTENVVQAVARDVFVTPMAQIAKDTLFHVHDEYVMMLPENRLNEIPELEKLITTVPDWLKGCPLATEAEVLDRYTK